MKTLALVIGNDDYHQSAKLSNAVNDANAIKSEFERLGFDVISKINCKATDISDIYQEFSDKISSYDATIFYYAGHGFELDGENYFATIECQIPPANVYVAKQNCIELDEFLKIFKKYPDKVNIVIIDACRKTFNRSGGASLAPVSAPQGSLIAFSTSPNDSASDEGFEGHSIYTGALLQYLGRERLSVEELFKKVRKTVFDLSNGRQVTWEHTSLINDYYFNIGQRVYSLNVPYDESVVKDINFKSSDEFGVLIARLRSYNWNTQNPAIRKLLQIPINSLDKNQLFILGRNLLQASGAAFEAEEFMQNISKNIIKYNLNDENHLLNGILYEIYFNPYGEFREDKTKKHHLEKILALRKIESLQSSFKFIQNILNSVDYNLIYIPEKEDKIIDVNVQAVSQVDESDNSIQIIQKITFNNIDITNQIKSYMNYKRVKEDLVRLIADFLTAPEEIVHIHSNLELNNISFN
jgi:hypothetical protein